VAANHATPTAANQAPTETANQPSPDAATHAPPGAANQARPAPAPAPAHLALSATGAPAACTPPVAAHGIMLVNRANTSSHFAQGRKANAATRNIGDPIMILAGAPQIGHCHNPQNMDQVDILDQMSQQMSDDMTQLDNLVHESQPTRKKATNSNSRLA